MRRRSERLSTAARSMPCSRDLGPRSKMTPMDNAMALREWSWVKSVNSGASFSAGVTAATTTGYFAPLTLGQERTSSDVAIAVDPNNSSHVIVAYGDAPGADGSGLLQLHVVESIDGGLTWTSKLTTPAAVRSELAGLSILANGAIGLLYASYDPRTDELSQHFLTATNDFATIDESTLATESNATPPHLPFPGPYLGDFFDVTSVGDTFYGTFSASNDDNGTNALFPGATFQRDFIGTPGTPSFQLVNLSGNPVDVSIDPLFFSDTISEAVPEPGTPTLFGAALLGLAALHGRRR